MNIDKLKKTMQEKQFSINSLAIKSNVGYATLHGIINQNISNPRINTVLSICKALNIGIEELCTGGSDGKSYFKNKKEKE